MRLSYSKLKTYQQCALRYRFTYLDRLPRRPRRLFQAGRRVHAALMRWLTYARTGGPSWEQVMEAYDTAYGALQEPGIRETRDYQEGLQILRDYHDANLESPGHPVHLEHKFAVRFGDHVLAGAMDRVDATETGYEIVDYKLDRELRSQQEVDEDLQLGLYQVGLEESLGIRPEALTLYFLRHSVTRTTSRTPAEATELRRWVRATGDDIAQDRQWNSCVGDHCAGCDFRSVCPAHTGRPAPVLPERLLRADVPSRQPLLALEFTSGPDPMPSSARAVGTEQLALALDG
ncbi:MAG: PD-(D/E)XK nuclease family protein [Armatimonadetes bacterium]|nr:PD-(D/E)XK nuclease family protein [Armatimonadota bacterium]